MANSHMQSLKSGKPGVTYLNQVHGATGIHEGKLEIASAFLTPPTAIRAYPGSIRLTKITAGNDEISTGTRWRILAAAMTIVEVHIGNIASTIWVGVPI